MKRRNKKSLHEMNPNYRVITFEDPTSIAAEAYRRIKVGLEFSEVDKDIKVIQVCSATKGEGKTTVMLNLAATYIEENKKVIIVDLDFRKPKVHRAIKVENKNGITDVLAGNIKLEEAIKTGENGLVVLNRGSSVPYPSALLNSTTLEDIFKTLKEQYDVILVDCPPILAVSDAVVVSRLCDGCIYVVSQRVTEKGAAKEAIAELRNNNVNILGCVYTEVTNKKDSYYSSKYRYYYQDYKSEK